VFKRGGHANNWSNAGVFAFNRNNGGTNANNSFRPCLVSPHFDAHIWELLLSKNPEGCFFTENIE